MKPCLKPQLSSTTFTTGTRQFVVHEAFERTWCFAGSYFWWLTPITIVDRKSTRLNSSHGYISYAVFCLKKKNEYDDVAPRGALRAVSAPPPLRRAAEPTLPLVIG